MRLAGAKEPRHPHSVGARIVGVGIQEDVEPLCDFIGQYIFVKFDKQTGFVVGFDDALYRAGNRFFEYIFQFHDISLKLGSRKC